jgi:hypothetical protein
MMNKVHLEKPTPVPCFQIIEVQKFMQSKYEEFPRCSNQTWLLRYVLDLPNEGVHQESFYEFVAENRNDDPDEEEPAEVKLALDLLHKEFGDKFTVLVWW